MKVDDNIDDDDDIEVLLYSTGLLRSTIVSGRACRACLGVAQTGRVTLDLQSIPSVTRQSRIPDLAVASPTRAALICKPAESRRQVRPANPRYEDPAKGPACPAAIIRAKWTWVQQISVCARTSARPTMQCYAVAASRRARCPSKNKPGPGSLS
ncbi:hypothetical protein B7463_g10194, partial [Scytalidium lignicola]